MEWNGMYLSKGNEWNEMKLSNLDWMLITQVCLEHSHPKCEM